MEAAVIRRYGGPEVVTIETLPDPQPGPGEVRVRVVAAPVTAGDARIRGLDVPPGFGPVMPLVFGIGGPRRPVFGWAFAGRVDRLGPGAEGPAPGTRVFGISGMRGGAHAELLCLPAGGRLLPLPDSLSDDEGAAFFFGGLTAAHFLIGAGRVAADERLLVHGASGAVGSAAVQIGAHLGARVTALCRPEAAAAVAGLGAAEVVPRGGAVPGPFDAILDVAGSLTWPEARALLAPGGRFLRVTAGLGATLGAALWPRRGGRRLFAGTAPEDRGAMDRLVALHLAGGYRPLVGPVLPFARIAEAHALASGRAKTGNVVVRMDR